MMSTAILFTIILTLADGAPTPDQASSHHAEAVEIFRCGFEENHDQNFDGWPDSWTRQNSAEFPAYIRVGIQTPRRLAIESKQAPEPAEGKSFLAVELEGRGAAVQSPRRLASSMYSYVLTGQLRATGLDRSTAYLAICFFDDRGRLVARHRSRPLAKNEEWTRVTVGPIQAEQESIRSVVAELQVEPSEALGDLKGAVYLDDCWLARMPRIALATNSEHNLYTDMNAVEVACQVSGIVEESASLTFELFDVYGQRIARSVERLEGHIVQQKEPAHESHDGGEHSHEAHDAHGEAQSAPHHEAPHKDAHHEGHDESGAAKHHEAGKEASDKHSGEAIHAEAGEDSVVSKSLGYSGETKWKPPITEYGFYRVKVTMRGSGGIEHERAISLAVLAPMPRSARGEFGWSLPEADSRFSMKTLVGLLPQAGIHWAKFPAWRSDKKPEDIDHLAWFAEKLSQNGIEMIGVLDEPPASMRRSFGEADHLPVASIFMEPALWHPAVDPVMTRLSLKVRWWQLGRDDDLSYVGLPGAEEKIKEIRDHFDRFGQVVNLGVNWNWLYEPESKQKAPWSFLNYQASPSLTAAELTDYLSQPAGSFQRWVQIQPLASNEYSLVERASDLAQRMVAAKIGKADAAFATNPFDVKHGLMNEDATPGELFLPWRTTSLLLSGARYVGSVKLPGGSTNHIFARGKEAIMVVWNDRPTKETMYFGEGVRQIDLWGKTSTPPDHEDGQTISVSRLPTFVTGVSLGVAEWQKSCHFTQTRLASVLGQWQEVELQFKSQFEQGVGGELTLKPPVGWEFDPPSLRFRAAPGQEVRESLKLRLRSDAPSGIHPIRLDFQVTSGRKLKFSVFDSLELGLDNVRMEMATRLNDEGQLVVEQTTINDSDRTVNFSCFLYAPDRRRLRQFVFDLGQGRSVNTFLLPDGAELLGKELMLRAEEIGGERVLNQRFKAEN